MSRALRRHHRVRLIEKRKFYYTSPRQRVFEWEASWILDPGRLGRMADTPTPCSCWMCGNHRRYQRPRLTLQERKFLEE